MPKRSFPPRHSVRRSAARPGEPDSTGATAQPDHAHHAAGTVAPLSTGPVPDLPGTPGPTGNAPQPAQPSTPARDDEPAPARSRPPTWVLPPEQPVQIVHPGQPADPPNAPRPPDRPPTAAATSRWRRLMRSTSASPGAARPGRHTPRQRELIERVQRALPGPHQVAVVSLKGGVGRTTVAALLGLTLAEHRGDPVIAVDSSPAGGTLADRLVGGTPAGIRDLIDRLDEVHALADVERFTGLVGRLRVLASDQDLDRNVALNSLEYERVCLVLQRHFPVIVTDGAIGPSLPGTLALAQGVVVVGSLTVDGAGRANRMLDWLIARGYRDAADRAVLVLDGDRASADVDAPRMRAHLAARCRAVVELPHDPHLAQGGRIDAAALAPRTRDAGLELAALVADEFGTVHARSARTPSR